MIKFKIFILAIIFLASLSTSFGQNQKVLGVGDKAPEFTLKNALGNDISLDDFLDKEYVILTWYRGVWCPYCNLALIELQEHLDKFKKLGAELIAISPQIADSTLTLQQKKELQFTLLSDMDNKIAKKYGISFTLDSDKNKLYEEKISLSKYNGNTTGLLPIPVTYIIDKEKIIRYAYINEDYTKRVDPNELIAFLKDSTE